MAAPALPFYDWGACPDALAAAIAMDRASISDRVRHVGARAPAHYSTRRGEYKVTGVTGVVVTFQPGPDPD